MKSIVLSLGILSLGFANEKTFRSSEREQEQYARIDGYIKNFNELFRLANKDTSKPEALLKSDLLNHLSKEDKKFLFTSLMNDSPSNIRLARMNSTVTILHNPTGLSLGKFDVANYSTNETIQYQGRAINLKDIFQEESLKARAKKVTHEVAKANEAKKSFARKALEAVFFVVTLPLNGLLACTTGAPPSGSDAALAGATPIYGPPVMRSFNGKGDQGGLDPMGPCIGYRDARGKCYGTNGHSL